MTRSELIARIGHRFPQFLQSDAELSVKTILNAIIDTLGAGNRVEIRGFGSFSVNMRPARVGRNPKSGESVSVPAKYVPHFKPGSQMKSAINQEKVTTHERLAA